MTESLPAVIQISTLDLEIIEVTENLSPPSSEQIARAILSMKKAGANAPGEMEWEEAAKVYEYALREVPAAALKTVVKKFVSGEYENIDYRYIPRPPELAAMARMEGRSMHEDLRRLHDKRATLETLSPRKKTSEAEMENVRRIHEEYKAWYAASKVKDEPLEPMTDEKAEYWRAIESLKDAPTQTRESKAFRSSIKSQIGDVE